MEINFKRHNFFPLKSKLSNENLDQILQNENLLLEKKISSPFEIYEISSIENIRNNSLIFLKKNFDIYPISNITVITDNEIIFNDYKHRNVYFVKNLEKSYNILLNNIFFHEDNLDFPDEFKKVENSFISIFAKIDPSTKILNNCTISRGVEIGKNCIIKNNVVIKNSIIKNNVIIGDNTTIGSTGFGFDLKNMGAYNLNPQLGIVFIDDNVSIGSNCSIDRGKIDLTYIGKNTMLDNQIHIAHNVSIASNVAIAAQVGISGSVKIGNNVIIGGQAGFNGHISIGDNVIIAGKSGVTKNISSNARVAGFPAIDINIWKKNLINKKKNGYK